VPDLLQEAYTLYRQDRIPEAVAAVEAAIRLGAGFADVYNTLGVYRTAAGDFAGAERALRTAIGMNERLVSAYHNLLELRDVEVPADLLQQMLDLAAGGGLGAADAALLDYCISRCYRRRQERALEFRYLDRAKSAMARLMPWDADGCAAEVAAVMAVSKARYDSMRNVAPEQHSPIVICGMPRAGSTLLERIVGAHPGVTPIGEAGIATRATQATVARHQLPQPLYPAWFARPDAAAAFETAYRAFEELLAGYPVAGTFACEKSANNDILLGLWLLAYPQAKVLHSRRHPLDVCLSCYQSYFANGVAFSNKLAWVAGRHALHERLMDHWKRLFPAQLLTVAYEDVVADPRAQIGRVLAFLGLPWDESCLAFHASHEAARSASNWQVRQPLYRESVHRWREYREQLGEIMHLADE
jgi:tetratricopeptide (TPR) repeat protein